MVPDVARSSPASTISRLVLPEPDGPTMPIASPAPISRSIPRRMLTGPAADGTVRCRSLTWTSGDGGVASMAAAYGVRGRWRKAVLALVFAVALMPGAQAAPVRLLVLGDSLSAGYGLTYADGFEAQLSGALHVQGRDVQIVDGAVSGDTTAGGLRDWIGHW